MKLYLQNIIDSIQMQTLPLEWQDFDFEKFSEKKKLFDYQQQALKNSLKALYKYYIDYKQDKNQFFRLYQNNGLTENLDLRLNGSKKYKIFFEFDKDYTFKNDTISFSCFINRMSFWMATGCGKTLVIVKLLELLGMLCKNNQIPSHNILFLTYREDLIEQFKNHIDEFNAFNNSLYINLFNLRDYERIKRENRLKWQNEIDVFYYRSDLISDEQKDKIINFRNYDDNGKWYILLDEAHKGDKEDSKRQMFYSILSRNGFLFNFSATFTDPIDFATCVYNFNLEKFIQQGYGKHIYLAKSDIEKIGEEGDFNEQQKQIIILKILLLHTLIKKSKVEKYHHKPLILTLVNSVNVKDSDLELFFSEIKKIVKDGIDENVLQQAKKELKQDLQHTCEFDNEKIEYGDNSIDTLIDTLNFDDIFKMVFNTEKTSETDKTGKTDKTDETSEIEVLEIPGNKQEIVLKLKSSDKPFALIKIGDNSEWIKNKLVGHEITEKFDNESVFKNINKDYSDINILMGSRAFYEGWDSNRPNIILYINIGKGTEAKKFVLQSIGRGVRIEPLSNKRKRLQFLYNNNEIDKTTFEDLKDKIKLIETLFIYGTKAKNLEETIKTLKEEKQEEHMICDLFQINPDINDKLLLIPVYKESEKILAENNLGIKFEINNNDLELLKNYYEYIGDKISLIKYDCQPKILKQIKESFRDDKSNDFYKKDKNDIVIGKPEFLMKRLIYHFSLKAKEFKEFKTLEDEIIHFKHIKLTEKQREEIEQKIKQVLNYKEKDKKIAEITKKIQMEPVKASEYIRDIELISQNYVKESEVTYNNERIQFKYLQNHYYLPVALTESEKETYLIHIIKTRSEVNFILDLENYLQKENNIFKEFEWWFFSKIDETLDEVYIPYYQPKTNRIEKFKPDFIFWLKKGNDYTILFIDPKGVEYTDGYRKIDGYSRIFENENDRNSRVFLFNGLNINVKLLLRTSQGIENVLENYRKYWFCDFNNFNMDRV